MVRMRGDSSKHSNAAGNTSNASSNTTPDDNTSDTDKAMNSICDNNDSIMIYWMSGCDKQHKQEILDLSSDELFSELCMKIDTIDAEQQKSVYTILNDSESITTLRHQFVKAIHNGGEYSIDDMISSCKNQYNKLLIECCISIWDMHLYKHYKTNLLLRKTLLAITFYFTCISYTHWSIRYSILIICGYIDHSSSSAIYNIFSKCCMMMYDESAMQYDSDGNSIRKHISSSLYQKHMVNRAEARMYALISTFFVQSLNIWFNPTWQQICIPAALIPLFCIEYEMYHVTDIKQNTQRIARTLSSITLLINQFLATYLLWYSKRSATFALLFFFPWATSFAVSSIFLLFALLLPLFGVIQLQLIDYDKRSKLVWLALLFSVYTLFRWGTAYYHTLISLCMIFLFIPPNAVQYGSISCTAIGGILLTVGVGNALVAFIKLLVVLPLTIVALALTQVLPLLLNGIKSLLMKTR